MANLREKIDAEVENIERVLAELPAAGACGTLSLLELAGVGTLLQNFYNGIENILKQCMTSLSVKLPRGETWHRDLIDLAASRGLVTSGPPTNCGSTWPFATSSGMATRSICLPNSSSLWFKRRG